MGVGVLVGVLGGIGVDIVVVTDMTCSSNDGRRWSGPSLRFVKFSLSTSPEVMSLEASSRIPITAYSGPVLPLSILLCTMCSSASYNTPFTLCSDGE